MQLMTTRVPMSWLRAAQTAPDLAKVVTLTFLAPSPDCILSMMATATLGDQQCAATSMAVINLYKSLQREDAERALVTEIADLRLSVWLGTVAYFDTTYVNREAGIAEAGLYILLEFWRAEHGSDAPDAYYLPVYWDASQNEWRCVIASDEHSVVAVQYTLDEDDVPELCAPTIQRALQAIAMSH